MTIIALGFLPHSQVINASTADEENIENALIALGADSVPQSLTSRLVLLWTNQFEQQELTSQEVQNRLEIAYRYWQTVAPEWRDVPNSLMLQVRECRDQLDIPQESSTTTTPTTNDVCGNELQIQLRFQHAERFTANLMQRLNDANDLPDSSKDQAIQTLERIRERVETRLREMSQLQTELLNRALGQTGDNQDSLNEVRTRLEQQTRQMNTSTSSPESTETGNTQQGVKK